MKERLKELRQALKMKQRELAQRLGVTVSLVGTWECGAVPIPDTRIYQICKEFRVRREWLEKGVGEMFEPPGEERKLEDFTDAEILSAALGRLYDLCPDDLKQAFHKFCSKIQAEKRGWRPISEYEDRQPTSRQ